MEISGNNENVASDASIMERKDEPETNASEAEAIQQLIRMDLAEKEVLYTRINATPSPDEKEPGAFEGIHLSKKEEEFLYDVDKKINTHHNMDLPPDNDALESEAIKELLREDLEMKQQSKADPVQAVGLRLRPIGPGRRSSSDSEDSENSNNNDNNENNSSSSGSEAAHLIEAELVESDKPPQPVFEAQQVDDEEIKRRQHRVRTIIISSIILTVISVVVAVALVLRFVVFRDEDDNATAAQTTTTKTTSAPTLAPTPSLSTTTLAPTPYTGTAWVPKGQFIHGTIEEQTVGQDIALSNDGSLLALPSAGNLDLGRLQGSFQVYRFDEMIQQWIPRGSRILGKTALDVIFNLAFSGDGTVFIGISPITNAGRAYEWDETRNDWSERKGNITAYRLSITDDGSVLVTVFPQTEEQTDGALIETQIWNETEKSWMAHGNTISIGEHLGQSGLHRIGSLSLDPSGTRFVVGASGPLGDGSLWGDSIWVYGWNGTGWTLLGNEVMNSSESEISSVDCSFECRNIAVGLMSGIVTVYTWKEDDNIWERKGQLLTGRNATDDYFGFRTAISTDGSRLAVTGFHYAIAYEWLSETKTWNQLGRQFDREDPAIAKQENYAVGLSMSRDGRTLALGASNADFVNASHTVPMAGRVEVYEWPSS